MHPIVAEPCLKMGKNLVTASYISPQMASYDEAARQKGLIFLNEIGLDPGIDHLSAMKTIHEAQAANKRVRIEVDLLTGYT